MAGDVAVVPVYTTTSYTSIFWPILMQRHVVTCMFLGNERYKSSFHEGGVYEQKWSPLGTIHSAFSLGNKCAKENYLPRIIRHKVGSDILPFIYFYPF
jgi:hypothetical protein